MSDLVVSYIVVRKEQLPILHPDFETALEEAKELCREEGAVFMVFSLTCEVRLISPPVEVVFPSVQGKLVDFEESSLSEGAGETAVRLLKRYRHAFGAIMGELGVPGDGYPVPVANAYEIARNCLWEDYPSQVSVPDEKEE